jgi:hypothetical protein
MAVIYTGRYDLLFSSWIFIYWVLYKLDLVSYNPINLIKAALLFVICSFLLNENKNLDSDFLVFMVVLTVMTKIIPIIIESGNEKDQSDKDGIILFLIYLIYIHFNDETVTRVYSKLFSGGFLNKKKIF